MATLRITVEAPDTDTAASVKEAHFKQLYEHKGNTVVFEVPGDAKDEADAIADAAKKAGCEASIEPFDDPLDDAEPVSFW